MKKTHVAKKPLVVTRELIRKLTHLELTAIAGGHPPSHHPGSSDACQCQGQQ